MHVGLDFGTTNTTAAIVEDTDIRLIPIDPTAPNPYIMRSALFIARDGTQLIGSAAIERYTSSNVGREINYTKLVLGQIEKRFVGGTDTTLDDEAVIIQDLYAFVDADIPGRLFQSLKTALGQDATFATNVFGQQWTIEELIAAQLRIVRERIEQQIDAPITHLTMGRPVHYGPTEAADDLALTRMRQASAMAGLASVDFVYEPVAAAFAYAATLTTRQNVLVFDFGGGTLDVTVMTLDPGGEHVVRATAGVVIGGDTLDSRIVMGTLLPYFGAGATLGPAHRPLPAFLHDQLSDWQQISESYNPRTLQIIEEAINTGDRPRELRALYALIRENYGLPLYTAVEQAKVRLSSAPEAEISLEAGLIDFAHTLTRSEFEYVIAGAVRRIGACVDEAVAASGLDPDAIDVVLQTGGSSRIPRFVRLLAERFGVERLHQQDAFTSVVAGLALAARETSTVAGPGRSNR